MREASPPPTSESLDRLREELAGASFVYVFGSILTAAFSDESDVDVAVDVGEPLTVARRLELVADLSAATGREVDVVDLRSADPIIKMQVLRYGRLLLVNDQRACYSFAMHALSEYADLKLDRAPVEAMIASPRAAEG